MWCLDHLDDIESDMSVFHRVEDITTLDGPRYFRLAHRLSAYGGVLSARVAEQQADHPATSTASSGTRPGQEVPLASLTAPTGTPGMPPLVEIAKVGSD